MSVRIRDLRVEGASDDEARDYQRRRRRKVAPLGTLTPHRSFYDKHDPYAEGFAAGEAGAIVEAMPGRFSRDEESAALWRMGWAEGRQP